MIEKHRPVRVFPFDGTWSDVGSWNAVADLSTPDADRKPDRRPGPGLGASNTYIHAPHRPVVALGTRDLLIVDTPDALLVADALLRGAGQVDVVAPLEQAQQARGLRASQGRPSLGLVRQHGRRASDSRSSASIVKPGASLSLQMHHHRAEHWVVVKGRREVTCGERDLPAQREPVDLHPDRRRCTGCATPERTELR